MEAIKSKTSVLDEVIQLNELYNMLGLMAISSKIDTLSGLDARLARTTLVKQYHAFSEQLLLNPGPACTEWSGAEKRRTREVFTAPRVVTPKPPTYRTLGPVPVPETPIERKPLKSGYPVVVFCEWFAILTLVATLIALPFA